MTKDTESLRILLLFEERALFRISLARLLESLNLQIIADCESGESALEVLNRSSVDVVLLKCDSSLEHGCEFIETARQAGYSGRFLIVSGSATPELIANALRLGASGIFLESEVPERLVQAIRLVANGEIWMDALIVQKLAEKVIDKPSGGRPLSSETLEAREQTVLQGILEGLTNKKIGAQIGLSEASVKNIVQRLFGKAGVKTRSQLVRVALDGTWGAPQRMAVER